VLTPFSTSHAALPADIPVERSRRCPVEAAHTSVWELTAVLASVARPTAYGSPEANRYSALSAVLAGLCDDKHARPNLGYAARLLTPTPD